MTQSHARLCRKSLPLMLLALFILLCSPSAGRAQSAEQNKEEEAPTKTINFKDAGLKAVLATMGKQLKINVVYDDAVKDSRVSIELKDMTIKAAMKIILTQQRLQARLIEDKTIIIFPDNETIRRRYEQYKVWPDEADKKQ